MDYFLLKQMEKRSISRKKLAETGEETLWQVESREQLRDLDYLEQERLVSGPLKILLESFLPDSVWKPCIFMEPGGEEPAAFWYLEPEPCQTGQMEFQEDGTPCSMKVDAEQSEIPRIFRVDTGKGTTEVIFHLSVVECMMRRGILGMKLVPVDIRF